MRTVGQLIQEDTGSYSIEEVHLVQDLADEAWKMDESEMTEDHKLAVRLDIFMKHEFEVEE